MEKNIRWKCCIPKPRQKKKYFCLFNFSLYNLHIYLEITGEIICKFGTFHISDAYNKRNKKWEEKKNKETKKLKR